ncbi:hypothetical protein [Serratia entomophila]|uniref:hypothetical protein n=1 Tax=Serratia entomophila TaxID=42906 RepID=UPI0021B81FEE|nr:hypothetical protein [Serratia entomophila]
MNYSNNESPLPPSSFKPHLRWLPSLIPVTWLTKLPEIRSVAALMRHEIYRVIQFAANSNRKRKRLRRGFPTTLQIKSGDKKNPSRRAYIGDFACKRRSFFNDYANTP